ncbi:MAG: Minimal nucleotidyltransferase fused to HEPN protein [archaeon GW2011_AR20]|nr:MAG: Minimal nucleotidyltransferase fused to HEPN protein [archaeon GW2011_AR20]MBS3160827.1 nucleotidyltransferase domain-containing protein [Candidatus Woesearchaeota archaeon]
MDKQVKIPDELKKKFEQLKIKLDKFKKRVLKEFNEYIIGITLLPPKEDNKEAINVLVLVDDSDSKKMSKFELKDKLSNIIHKFAEEIDKNLNVETLILSELKENCFDGKYEILQLIAMSAPVYDPKEMLAAIKIAEVHKSMVLKKFEKYIMSYVAAGSLFRGDKKANDIDVFIIVDDTDVKRMSRYELKERLRYIIIEQGYQAKELTGVNKDFHVQTYILTDFWDSVKDANPVIFTFLRDGVPLFDRGVFMPWRLLLQMGRIKPSPEAIDMQMDIGAKLLDRVKGKLLSVVAEDIYYAALNPAQAALMLYGVNPPTPLETIELMREILVNKEKLIEEKHVKFLEKVRNYYKDIEHGKIKEVSGREIDELVKETKEYLERIKKLFVQLEKRKESESILDIYNACIAVTRDLFTVLNIKEESSLENTLKKVVDSGELPRKFLDVLKRVIKARDSKLSKAENEKIRREARSYIKNALEFIQRKRGFEKERSKVKFKYGEKEGELYLLDKKIFLIKDIKEKEIMKTNLNENGSFGNLSKSSQEELEEELKNIKAHDIYLKEKTVNSLKQLIGKDVEILVG